MEWYRVKRRKEVKRKRNRIRLEAFWKEEERRGGSRGEKKRMML